MRKESISAKAQKSIGNETYHLNFKKLNNLVGWGVFAIATAVYLMTVERTASFWDCGEFIACAYKLEVPHPPGSPFYLLFNRVFSLLAHDVYHVAFWINVSSALCSSFSILFLFWSITLIGAKLFPEQSIKNLNDRQILTLLGAGVIGSLAYTFSDSFWFSAVEAEVYAMSSFFTALVIWAMLKWELIEDPAAENRWLIMIAYTMGLSIGVHLLNLVTIPVLGLIYYYKKYREPDFWGVIAALAVSSVIVMIVLEGVIPGLPTFAGNFEIFFVNTLGLSFGSGIIFISVILIGGLSYGVYYSHKNGKVILNTALLSLTFILVGYSCYAIVLIRANYNPPINENDPSDIIKFVSYLKREQYGDRPLLYGPSFNSDVQRNSDGSPIQISKGKLYRMNKEEGKYEIYDERKAYLYEDNMLLPRIYSRQDNHKELYLQKIFGEKTPPEDYVPNMGDNLSFMFSHQLGHMYWRYFLWNFAGRAGDFEGAGALTPFDSTADLPEVIANNPGRNQYYMLPLLLGILGLFYTYLKSKQTFFITTLLFFLTGLALVLYLNSPPVEPRERDYIYVGSYYVFAIWIGIGVMYLTEVLAGFLKNGRTAAIVATALMMVVPVIMGVQNWDDHDRSNRYHSVDSAKNLLNSCAPNAILFTGGDNDTFPLWYAQEVEGFRTDVRVCNLSLLGTDWYIDQMQRQTYESAPLPISLPKKQYYQGTNDQILYPPSWRITPNLSPKELAALDKQGMDLVGYMKLVAEGDRRIKAIAPGADGEELTIFPSKKMVLKIDIEKVKKMGFVPKNQLDSLKDFIAWDIQRNDLYKSDLMILDMIATNQWKRPIYFSTTLSNSSYLNLKEFMQREGLAFRLMPFKVEGASQGFVNTDIMYKNLVENFFWRDLDNPNTYYDENYQRFTINLRNAFAKLAEELLKEGKKDKAKKAILFCLEKMPDNVIPYDVYTTQFIDILFELGEDKKAMDIAQKMAVRADSMLEYVLRKDRPDEIEMSTNFAILSQVSAALERAGKKEEANKYKAILDRHYNKIAP